MSRLVRLLLMLGLGLPLAAQTTTTYTGVIKDLTQQVVTSGQVTFTLSLSSDSTIPGNGRFVPTTTLCNINADGTLSGFVAGVVSGACNVTMNTALSPAGTSYKVCIQANYQTPGSCFFDYAVTSSKDISTIVPTLQTGPINYGVATGPPGPVGPPGPAGTTTATGVSGNFLVPGALTANLNHWESPLTHGVVSNGSLNTILATGTAGSGALSLSAASDFVVGNGVMIAHAGAACGSVKGGNCSSPPTPVVTVRGSSGSTTYSYKLACVDGLGGIGSAGAGASTTSGAATLAGVVLANTVSGNYNAVTWSGNSSCFEVAIYRNNVLIATEYSAPSGTMTYNDIGIGAWTNRDLPASPPGAAVNDNYIGIIQSLSGTTATVSPNLGASVSGVRLYHSDTPLIQAAINVPNRGSIDLGAAAYVVNYPINFTKTGGDMRGGNAVLSADTGDIFMDLTGGTFEHLYGFAIGTGNTNPSTIGLYCSRDTTISGDTAQSINTDHIIIANINSTGHALGGRGSVGYYNHACEIQQNLVDHIEADRLFVFTANNVDHVSSLFDVNDDQSSQSMSAIDVISLSGGTIGAFAELDSAYTINFIGGYALGGNSTTHPYAFEFDPGQSGRFRSDGFRVEAKGGDVYLSPGTTLREPYINTDLYRDNGTLPGIYISSGSSVVDADMIRIDDFGGSSVVVPIIDGAAGCSVSGSNIRLGVWENLGTCTMSGAGNIITGASSAVPSNDFSLNPGYPLNTGSTASWVKLGTWVANSSGDTLNIRVFSGTGDNSGGNQQALADVIVRAANGSSAPNISGASMLTFGLSPFSGLKVVATGGSTSGTNVSWDIYVQESGFSAGTYHVEKLYSDQWINSSTLTSDPGAASSTVVVGTIQAALSAPSLTPGGTCTPNGFITLAGGLKVATCM